MRKLQKAKPFLMKRMMNALDQHMGLQPNARLLSQPQMAGVVQTRSYPPTLGTRRQHWSFSHVLSSTFWVL